MDSWHCQQHGYICVKGEPGEEKLLKTHRTAVHCRRILQVKTQHGQYVRFKVVPSLTSIFGSLTVNMVWSLARWLRAIF